MHAAGKAAVRATAAGAGGAVPTAEEPEDVAAERVRVEALTDYEANPIVVRQLNKTYPGLDGQPPKVGKQGPARQQGGTGRGGSWRRWG